MTNRAVISIQCGHYANFIGAHFWNIQESSFEYGGPSSSARAPPASSAVAVGGDPDAAPEICHDVLFREGLTAANEITFTPRLVAIDLKGALGLLPEFGELYGGGNAAAQRSKSKETKAFLWEGQLQVAKEEARSKNEYMRHLDAAEDGCDGAPDDKDVCSDDGGDGDRAAAAKLFDLSADVRVWSDFLRMRFHPKTSAVVNEYQHRNALLPFDVFGLGSGAWRAEGDAAVGEDVQDRIRFFAEEADAVQGFHLTTDATDGFAGLGTAVAEHLSDEYGNKCTVAFPVSSSSPTARAAAGAGSANATRLLNTALCVRGLVGADAAAVTPLGLALDAAFPIAGRHRQLPGLRYDPCSDYHSSAVLAAGLDTATLAWRTSAAAARIGELAAALGAGGRRVAALAVELPFGIDDGATLVDALESSTALAGLTSLTPGTDEVRRGVFVQAVTLRGVPHKSWRSKTFGLEEKSFRSAFRRCGNGHEAVRLWLGSQFGGTSSGSALIAKPLPLSKPFPQIFAPFVGPSGRRLRPAPPANPSSRGCGGGATAAAVHSAPVLSAWQSSAGVGAAVDALQRRAAKLNLHKLHRFADAGLEADELAEAIEDLRSCAQAYTHTDRL